MISVIVPMYNSEHTINRCLLSIMQQTYQYIEIIVIDDGSFDKSSEIVLQLAKTDSRIRYIKQENSGVSSARNRGIVESEGEYICFVDSDDAISKDYLLSMYNKMQESNSDIVMCGYKEVSAAISKDYLLSEADLSSLQGKMTTDLYFLKRFINSPCMKIYRKDKIEQCMLRFQGKMVLAEDQFFNYHYYALCETVSFVNYANYNYYRDYSKLSKAVSLQCFYNEIQNLSYKITYLENYHINNGDIIIAEYICYLIRQYIFIQGECNNRREACSRLKKMNIYMKCPKLPQWKDNIVYWLLYHKKYSIIYIYKLLSQYCHI